MLPLIALAALTVGAYLLHGHPQQTLESGPGYAIQRATGLHCPGCRTTRAVAHLAKGEPLQALGSNALIFVTVPLISYLLIAQALRQWSI
ncbi:MAG: hypothetical protein ACI8XO_000203 [Verrucomicrobiales bacterium]